MNTNIEIYKKSLYMTNEQTISTIKKAKYILSKLEADTIGFSFYDIPNNKDILDELKKLINITTHLIQKDKISECVLQISCLDGLKNIMGIVKFSGISNKFHIYTKTLNDNGFIADFTEFNVEIGKKCDIIFNKRYVLDQKQEYVIWEDIKGEK